MGAGGQVQGLSADEQNYFQNGLGRFESVDTVTTGLGPGFNLNQCSGCHAQPAIGGSSPSVTAFPNIGPNPQVAVANLDGALNIVPSFITPDGPVREARFIYATNANGSLTSTPDGGVHDVFTIAGRSDGQSCQLAQPNFEQQLAQGNVIFRIPTPVFGAGMMEGITDDTIMANMQANSNLKQRLGIAGQPNRNGNDGTISRFGWKAQNKSLQIFSGEAYNVEMGVTNELFPSERGYPPTPLPANCLLNATPEDGTNFMPVGSDTAAVPSDVVMFSTFMRMLDQPTPACTGSGCSASVQNGANVFSAVGCALCHTPTMQTGPSYYSASLSNVNANLFSDLLVHNMGTALADGVSQGTAGPSQFRTAPLWGVGQRVFFLHDGRTSDLQQAILAHASSGSEANGVISQYRGLTQSQKQDLLNFLRSL
jgi:CxxC motif-containing protein (DUF1111 family)